MASEAQISALKAGWDALAAGEMDKLASFYAEDMIFVLPGQDDVLEGRAAFRAALDGKQVPRIRRGLRPPGDHSLVARLLALHLKAAHGEPDQGMEPVDGARELHRELHRPVAVLHVQ